MAVNMSSHLASTDWASFIPATYDHQSALHLEIPFSSDPNDTFFITIVPEMLREVEQLDMTGPEYLLEMSAVKRDGLKVGGLLSEDANIRTATFAKLAARGPGAFSKVRSLLYQSVPWHFLAPADQPDPFGDDPAELYPWALRVASVVQICRAVIEHARKLGVCL